MIQNMVAPALRAPFKKPRPVVYPGSDGKPLAETETHFLAIAAFVALLRRFFANRSDVYAHGCNFIYYEEGNNKARFSPDAYVVFGVEKKNRRSYFMWEEKRPPAIVVEFTSRKTKNEDAIQKKELCARLGVKEYFMCDPESAYLKPPLQGYRLKNGLYEAIASDADGKFHSIELGTLLRLENRLLAMYDAKTGEKILSSDEAEVIERERAAKAEHQSRNAESEIVRLREELERLKKQKS